MKRHISPALLLSVVAVVLAAAGSATAAGMISGLQIRNNSVTGSDIRNRSLTPLDFRGSVRGPAGPAGAPGPSGTVTQTIAVVGPQIFMGESGSSANVQSSKAECPPGTVVVGGGFDTGVRTFIGFQGMSGNGYFVIGINNGVLTTYIQAQAICGTAPATAAPVTRSSLASAARDEQKTLARLRAQANVS